MNIRKNEVSDFLCNFLHSSIELNSESTDCVWNNIYSDAVEYNENENNPLLRNSLVSPFLDSESPDIIYECDNFIMGIECFEFDASKRTKKGSSQKRNEVDAKDKILSEYYEARKKTDGTISIKQHVDNSFSLENYKNSLMSVFAKHAEKIQQYREKLSKNSIKKVYLSFYIKDSTALGSYVCFNQKITPFQPFYLKEFREALKETKGLDYVIANVNNNYIHTLYIQRMDDSLISQYSKFDSINQSDFVPYEYNITSDYLPLDDCDD